MGSTRSLNEPHKNRNDIRAGQQCRTPGGGSVGEVDEDFECEDGTVGCCQRSPIFNFLFPSASWKEVELRTRRNSLDIRALRQKMAIAEKTCNHRRKIAQIVKLAEIKVVQSRRESFEHSQCSTKMSRIQVLGSLKDGQRQTLS